MRRALIAALCVALVAAPVLAEDGPVCIFSDASGSTCSFTDNGGVMEFYVIHQPDAGVSAVEFAAPVPSCMTGASWIADINQFPLTLGNSQLGMSVAYGGCLTGPIHVTTINVATTGSSQAGCAYPVIPDPAAPTGYVEVVDCAGVKHLGQAGTAYVNSPSACRCGVGPGDPNLDVSPLVVTFNEFDISKPLSISNVGPGGPLNWQILESVTWLFPNPVSGSGNQVVDLSVNRFGVGVGHYTETFWVASNGGNATVTVELDVGENPVLGLNPTALTFDENTSMLSLSVYNTGTGAISWSIDPPLVGWLSVDPASGTGATDVDVSVDRTGLAQGVYNTTLHVTSNGGDADVPVTLEVGAPPLLGYSPPSLDFGTSSNLEILNIFNSGGTILSWSITPMAPWVSAIPPSGTNNATVFVAVDRAGLAPGTHTTYLDVSSNGGNAQIPVSLVIPAPVPALGVTPGSLAFAANQTQKQLSIFNAGTGTLTWNVAPGEPWMSVSPTNGTDGGIVNVSVDRTGLADSTYNGHVHITSNGGNTDIPVSMVVDNTPTLSVSPTLVIFYNTTSARTFNVSNAGGGTLSWTLSADQPWIQIDPPLSGDGNATVTVHVDFSQIPGTQLETGFVTVSSNGGVEMVEVRYIPPGTGGPAGAVALYSDPAFIDCSIVDIVGLVEVYVVHTAHSGATAVQFSAPVPSCWGAVWLADTNPFPLVIGNTQDGMAVSYGGCLNAPVHVTTMLIYGQALAGNCCQFPVLPDPNAPTGRIEAVDCALTKTYPSSQPAVVNAQPWCPCGFLVSVETKTWGGVKALYAPEEGEKR